MVWTKSGHFSLFCFLGYLDQDNVFPWWGKHITRNMFFPAREHISLGISVSLLGEPISLGICVSMLGKHISLGMCFLGRGTRITSEMCFPVGGTDITKDKCFPCNKTFITRPVLQLFLVNFGQENVFYDILERENAFLGYKKKKLKLSKS